MKGFQARGNSNMSPCEAAFRAACRTSGRCDARWHTRNPRFWFLRADPFSPWELHARGGEA